MSKLTVLEIEENQKKIIEIPYHEKIFEFKKT